MYVHVGDDVLVKLKDIITILDYGSVENSPSVKEFLTKNENRAVYLKGPHKSIVVVNEALYYSPLSSGTLKKRTDF